ncbi:MAG: hypothetical protein AAGF10_05515, partial [Verrucomicrobiota bacterium]
RAKKSSVWSRPSVKRYLINGIIALIPALVLLSWAANNAYQQALLFLDYVSDDSAQVLMPGEIEFAVEEPERYAIWLYTQIHYEGTFYRIDAIPDGTRMTLIRVADNAAIPIKNPYGTHTRAYGSTESKAVGYVDLEQPGRYQLSAIGAERKFVLSVDPDRFKESFAAMGLAVFWATGGLTVSAIVFAVILVLLLRRSKKLPPASKLA